MLKRFFVLCLVIILTVSPLEVLAEELIDISDEEQINVSVPVFYKDDMSILDYILDPYGIVDEAERYEDFTVETNERFYFRNYEGDYDYSHISDDIAIVNEGESKVALTLSLELDSTEYVEISTDRSFADASELDKAHMYLAILDSDGNEIPVDSSGVLVYSTVLDSKTDGDNLDEFHFRLVGDCSTNGDWGGVVSLPNIALTLKIEIVDEENEDSTVEDSGAVEEQIDVPLEEDQLDVPLEEDELSTEETETIDNTEDQEESEKMDDVDDEAAETDSGDVAGDTMKDADSTEVKTDVDGTDSSNENESTSSITN